MRGDQEGEEAPESSRNESLHGHSQETLHGLRSPKGTCTARKGWQAGPGRGRKASGPGRVPAEAERAQAGKAAQQRGQGAAAAGGPFLWVSRYS